MKTVFVYRCLPVCYLTNKDLVEGVLFRDIYKMSTVGDPLSTLEDINLLLIDIRPIVVSGIKDAINSQWDWNIKWHEDLADARVAFTDGKVPDLIILGSTATSVKSYTHQLKQCMRIKKETPGIPVVLLLNLYDHAEIHSAYLAGAESTVSIFETTRSFLCILENAVLARPSHLPSKRKDTKNLVNIQRPSFKKKLLSGREEEVLRLLAQGLTNREIAGALFLSPETIKTYISRMFKKLNVSNRAEAAVRGLALLGEKEGRRTVSSDHTLYRSATRKKMFHDIRSSKCRNDRLQSSKMAEAE